MQPEVSTPQSGPEKLPVQYGETVEHAPQPSTPESGIENGAERFEQAADSRAAVADATGIPLIMPEPIAIALPVDDVTTVPINPIAAGDEDVIEKEWVDRAKKIIAETKDDPYKREQAVTELQTDYLRKRYGREPGAAN
jgi:hypothetical protein